MIKCIHAFAFPVEDDMNDLLCNRPTTVSLTSLAYILSSYVLLACIYTHDKQSSLKTSSVSRTRSVCCLSVGLFVWQHSISWILTKVFKFWLFMLQWLNSFPWISGNGLQKWERWTSRCKVSLLQDTNIYAYNNLMYSFSGYFTNISLRRVA